MAASATFALKAGVWFRRGRRFIVSPDSRATACPPSGRNSTYRPVQISGTSSPFLIGHVGLVSVRLANMLFSGGWGPHGNSGVGVRTLWNHVDPNHSTLFETAS